MDKWDVVVVGGGAAGFFGAITCAEAAGKKARILILERAARVLQKVKISGGGRCNVTHDCLAPKEMAARYPRGNKELIGPFYRFGVRETIQWFESRGVQLKTEGDGRVFPVSDDSQTIIDCLRSAAQQAGVALRTRAAVTAIDRGSPPPHRFEFHLRGGERLQARRCLVATGGTRLGSSATLPDGVGHELTGAVPSLFTFQIQDPLLEGMPGVAVEGVQISVPGRRLSSQGPLLITHWGISGPAVLELSAWGARQFFELGYDFTIHVDWLPGVDLEAQFHELRKGWGARQVKSHSPFESISRRLWQRFVAVAGIDDNRRWAEFSRSESGRLIELLSTTSLSVTGQSTFKDEFVTCGGVPTDQLDMRTMESDLVAGLFFAGEVVDIDGITGGYNFQNAWTTGFLAGQAMAGQLLTS